ncbi:hypothetical protein HPP92_006891 [Vanilla planifolia]|uniref:Cytochrome P450 n=1 Tax=Vanilla planifolia TaxID=51239 RepID=A0A835V8W2_VANPL|nr:hypothetical protein HPP92_006891 [Vanilla planifolia]
MIEEHISSSEKERSKGISFLDVLLNIQENDSSSDFHLTKEHIKANLLIMIATGTETSFAVLDWTMAKIIRNPSQMRKTQAEIREIPKGEATVREEHLSKMLYLKAVIKESLRLNPPVPLLLPRECIQDCQINGYEIPKTTRVLINAWAIGRDPENWESSEEFKPERFMKCSIDDKGNHFEFIPFGSGRRMCAGMQFAPTSIELTLWSSRHGLESRRPFFFPCRFCASQWGNRLRHVSIFFHALKADRTVYGDHHNLFLDG